MEKDKEAMALLQNKRQEFRCNLVLKAVNKEQNIRERELSHESSQFKVRLQKLIQKRKELNLDPMKTRELELFLNPGLKSKVVSQSPLKKVSSCTIQESQLTKEIDNKTFVTKMKQESNSSDQISGERRAAVKEHETRQRDCNNGENTRGQGVMEDTTHSPFIPPLDRAQKQYSKSSQSLNNNNTNSTSDAVVETMPLKGGKWLSFIEKGMKGDPEMTDLKARALKRSASNLQLKIGNVQQWLEEMDNANDSKFIYKRVSAYYVIGKSILATTGKTIAASCLADEESEEARGSRYISGMILHVKMQNMQDITISRFELKIQIWQFLLLFVSRLNVQKLWMEFEAGNNKR
eukprot:gene12542-3237_t